VFSNFKGINCKLDLTCLGQYYHNDYCTVYFPNFGVTLFQMALHETQTTVTK